MHDDPDTPIVETPEGSEFKRRAFFALFAGAAIALFAPAGEAEAAVRRRRAVVVRRGPPPRRRGPVRRLLRRL